MGKPDGKHINLALQGGGAHGAFTWGVLDALLEDGRLSYEGITGTSAGSMNAVVMLDGLLEGEPERAREKLHAFWLAVSTAGSPLSAMGENAKTMFSGKPLFPDSWPVADWMRMWDSWISATAQGTHYNPLRDLLATHVDFERLRACPDTKLFLAATDVNTGNVRVFNTPEIDTEVVLASACLPYLYPAIEIHRHHSGTAATWATRYCFRSSTRPRRRTSCSCT